MTTGRQLRKFKYELEMRYYEMSRAFLRCDNSLVFMFRISSRLGDLG